MLKIMCILSKKIYRISSKSLMTLISGAIMTFTVHAQVDIMDGEEIGVSVIDESHACLVARSASLKYVRGVQDANGYRSATIITDKSCECTTSKKNSLDYLEKIAYKESKFKDYIEGTPVTVSVCWDKFRARYRR